MAALARSFPTRLMHRVAALVQRPAAAGLPPTAALAKTAQPCINCGGSEAYVTPFEVQPDFDPAILPSPLRRAFLTKQNGYCTVCGVFQDFNRLSPADFRALNALGKDELTSDPTYHSYPPPAAAVRGFDAAHFAKRVGRWDAYFSTENISMRRALFVRVWFGAAPRFIAARFGAEICGIDMSPTCLRYTSETVPRFRALEGESNGIFEGPFLATGPYDAVFVFHVLTHSSAPRDMLRQIRSLLAPGGVAVFTNEIERKPQNPFHNVHLSEPQLLALLRQHFDRVDRIDDCEEGFVPHACPYTAKGDVPDFVART
jgi:SAM-dependent methyltransferase